MSPLFALRGFLGRIPRVAWIALAIGLALLALYAWHKSEVRHADRAGYARAMAEVQVKAERIRREAEVSARKAEQLQRDISTEERTKADEQARTIADRADALRRLRPQATDRTCPRVPAAISGSSSGSDAPGGVGDVAAVAVDWQWLVNAGEAADLNRAEVLSWRQWYDRQSKAYEAWRAETIRLAK